jgi:hypothetical protein
LPVLLLLHSARCGYYNLRHIFHLFLISNISAETVFKTRSSPVLAEFPAQAIPVPAGAGPISIPRNRTIVLTRAQLDEDPSIIIGPDFDADEIRCRIRIHSVGIPPEVTPDAFTDQEVLGGLVVSAATAGSTSD